MERRNYTEEMKQVQRSRRKGVRVEREEEGDNEVRGSA